MNQRFTLGWGGFRKWGCSSLFYILVVVCLKQLPLVLDRFYKLNPNLSDFFGQSKVFENVINFILGKKCKYAFFSTGGGGCFLSEPPDLVLVEPSLSSRLVFRNTSVSK